MELDVVWVAGLILLSGWIAWITVRKVRLPRQDWWLDSSRSYAANREALNEELDRADDALRALRAAVNANTRDLEPHADFLASSVAARLLADRSAVVETLENSLGARRRSHPYLKVVLFGRTKSGKTSLFYALTGSRYGGIGDGGQNVTTEPHGHRFKDVELIDTPGISGVGSAPLELSTTAAIEEADAIVINVTDDRVSKEDFERINALSHPRRPILIAVNVRAGDLDRLLTRPDLVFRQSDLDAHVARLRAGLQPFADRELPVVAYHGYAAAEARRHLWSLKRSLLWRTSRIGDVEAELTRLSTEAATAASAIPAELVAIAESAIRTATELAREEVVGMVKSERRLVEQVEGILEEISARRGTAHERITRHFTEAEVGLLDALESDTKGSFSKAAEAVLNRDALAAQLRDHVEAAKGELVEKFSDLQEELELLEELDLEVEVELDAVWAAERRRRRTQEQREKKVQRRKVARSATRVAAGLVGGAIGFLAGGGAGASLGFAIADEGATRVIDKALPEVRQVKNDPRARLRAVRSALSTARDQFCKEFDRALEAGLLAPTRASVVAPRRASIKALGAVEVKLEQFSQAIDGRHRGD
jgi:hypothetical protein